MPYLRNRWYMAAWGEALAPGEVIGRTILDEPIALFRDREGVVGAVQDRCPHRFAPLSAGKVDDKGVLVCGYHGLGFDRTGACARNPHGAVLRAMRIGSRPLVERDGILWIWMGQPERADSDMIPDFSWLERAPPTAKSYGEIVSGGGGYELYVDNIMDLSHTDYLHADTLGQGGVVFNKPKVSADGDWIEVVWQSRDARPPAFYPRMIPDLPELVDLTLRVRWFPAAAMRLDSEIRYEGMPDDACHRATAAHIFTPESADRTHYFYAMARNYAEHDEALNRMIAEARTRIFETEDKPMVERVHARMNGRDFWEMKPLLLRIDEGGVQVRRRLQALIAAEQGRPALAAG